MASHLELYNYSGFSQTHEIGHCVIITNFVFHIYIYICNLLHYLHPMMLVNVKLDATGYKRFTF